MGKAVREYVLGDIDNLHLRFSCGINMIISIHTAMEEGVFAASSCADAIFGVSDYLGVLNDELRECVDALLEEERKERVR